MTQVTQQAGAIVLAAGFGRRFGKTKQLARLSNGNTVIEQTLLNLLSVTSNILVVTRAEIRPTLEHLKLPLCIFDNADQGMGASLAFAMSQIPNWNAAMICLGDMPFISAASYSALLGAADETHIIVPTIDSHIANPCVFGRRFFDELKKLQGDKGGRSVIDRHPDALVRLQMTDLGLLQDIDTPADLANLQS
ncbi:MAG: molybdenum cofactor cytidylyltransferase [Pseudohongiellaceae bacterium]|jgi:molybdenum cofactor cytidylyltransferase